jgi:hypothetical protein
MLKKEISHDLSLIWELKMDPIEGESGQRSLEIGKV